MGAESFRKYVSSSLIICYRSVSRHPFLIGIVIVLFSMYRLFPLLFSLLVSASPVIVSTAVLLGTLLSFGQPNIPEIEKETESDRDEIRKFESKVMSSHTETVGRDASFASEEINGSRLEVGEKSFGEKVEVLVNDDTSCVENDRPANLTDEFEKLQFGEEHVVEESKNEMDEDNVVLGSHYSPLQQSEDAHIVSESDDKLWEGSADPLNSDPVLLWKRVEGGETEYDEGSDSADSGSDLAESSSPDASMADIIPMLDELHPLLSEEPEIRQPAHMRDNTDAASEHSLESSDSSSSSSSESNDNGGVENHEELDVGDDEDEDKESEHADKKDEVRSAITWTEDDQKNLMNLGTSEMERNRRLENLIARRRARKLMKMQAEKNLIDLDSADLPWNISPISTARNNPFDYDSNDNIPGSAPSVLLQRRNPFDLPYDSSEEKPDLVGDTFQQEFAAVQPKEPFFRRYESFNVGPSNFGARQETKLRPYFVPEHLASDGTFSSFQRQLSGLSDSKLSSVPDTDSVSSVDDVENGDHIEDDHLLETEVVSEKDHEHLLDEPKHVSDHVSHGIPYFVPESSFQRQLSEVSESKGSSIPDTESVSSADDLENKIHIEEAISQEPELISVEENEHASQIREHPELISVEEHEHASETREHLDLASESENLLDESDHVGHGTPYFVPEHVASDVTNFSAFQRQLSEVSKSKGSSVPDSESVSSADDLENKVHIQEEISQEAELIFVEERELAFDIREHPDLASESENLLDESNHVSDHVSHGRPNFVPEQVASDGINFSSFQRQISEEGVSEEAELISVEQHEHVSDIREHPELVSQINHPMEAREHVSQGSESSDDGIVESIQGRELDEELVEAEVSIGAVMHQQEAALDLYRIENATSSGDLMSDAIHLNLGDQELHSNASSYEVGDQVYIEKEGDEVATSVSETGYYFVDRDNSIEKSDIDVTGLLVDENRLVEPKYDSSPRDVTRNPSSSSISNDLQAYITERGQPPAILERTDPFSDRVFQETEQKIDMGIPGNDAEFIDLSETCVVSRSITDHNSTDSSPESSVAQNQLLTTPDNSESLLAGDNIYTPIFETDDGVLDMDASLDDNHQKEAIYQPEDVSPLSEDPEEPQVHVNSNNSDSLWSRESVDDFPPNINSASSVKPDEISDIHSIETKVVPDSVDDENEIQEIDESLLVELDVVGDFGISDLEPTVHDMKEETHTLEHDLETKHPTDEDSSSKDFGSTLNETKPDPNDPENDLETISKDIETKQPGDDSYSMGLGSTMNEMKQDPHSLDHDLEKNHSVKDSESSLNEMKRDPHVLEQSLETFYSVDEFAFSKIVESTLKEMKHDPLVEVVKSGNDKEISATEAEASLSNSSNDTTVNQGGENGSCPGN